MSFNVCEVVKLQIEKLGLSTSDISPFFTNLQWKDGLQRSKKLRQLLLTLLESSKQNIRYLWSLFPVRRIRFGSLPLHEEGDSSDRFTFLRPTSTKEQVDADRRTATLLRSNRLNEALYCIHRQLSLAQNHVEDTCAMTQYWKWTLSNHQRIQPPIRFISRW